MKKTSASPPRRLCPLTARRHTARRARREATQHGASFPPALPGWPLDHSPLFHRALFQWALLLCANLFAVSCDADVSPPAKPLPVGAPAAPAAPATGPLVVFLGDSVTAGYAVPKEQAFPSVLQEKMAQDGTPFRLVNAGESGATTAGGVARLEWLLSQKPAVLVVELGANDALRGQSLASIEANLGVVVTRAREAHCPVLLLGMRIPPSYGEYAEQFSALYARLQQEFDVEMIPFFMDGVAGDPALNLPDGIHPTAEGHARLAENVRPVLHRMLTAVGTGVSVRKQAQ